MGVDTQAGPEGHPSSSGSPCPPELSHITLLWVGTPVLAPNREGNGNPLQYSCLENPTDGGAWWATVHGISKSRTRLSAHTHTYWSRVDPNPMPSVLIRRENRDMETFRYREKTEQRGMQLQAKDHSGGRCGLDSLSEPSERADPAQHLDLRPLASSMRREYGSVAWAFHPRPEPPPQPLIRGPLCDSHGKPTQHLLSVWLGALPAAGDTEADGSPRFSESCAYLGPPGCSRWGVTWPSFLQAVGVIQSDGEAGTCESRDVAGAKEGMGPPGHGEPEQALGSGVFWPPQREAGLRGNGMIFFFFFFLLCCHTTCRIVFV